MFFRVKKSLADDEDELGAVARAVIYSFTDDVDSGAAYWLKRASLQKLAKAHAACCRGSQQINTENQ